MATSAAPGASLAHWSLFAAFIAAAGLSIYIHAPTTYAETYGIGLASLGLTLALLYGIARGTNSPLWPHPPVRDNAQPPSSPAGSNAMTPSLAPWSLFTALIAAAGLPIYIHAPTVYTETYGIGLASLGLTLALLSSIATATNLTPKTLPRGRR
jgi:hypothetical protein